MSEDRGKAGDAVGSSDHEATGVDANSHPNETSRPSGKRPGRRNRAVGAGADSAAVTAGSAAVVTPAAKKKSKTDAPRKENLFKRLRKFLREVMSELRKVIWPNRKQMITYTTIVLVFVSFMVAYISGLDLAFIQGVRWLFG
ncbi:preprotein translocase subunit SecE [Rhodococcus kronopolitis]|uniref:Protein translocase subunit SecE n=1 Tax=Rhodococcus kronopolitis TaxID=1460226 RepID=A0ABV9FTE8_9NOCA